MTKPKFRSAAWFSKLDKDGFIHRSWVGRGLPPDVFDGRPIVGICNTWSELTPCNGTFRELAEHVKRGVWEAGGLPFEFPVMSTGETSLRPTAMLFRNLVSMDVEESIRGNPIDGVVLLCGCDKTTPSLIMGAASCDLPAIVVSGGAMLNGNYRGKPIGSGTDVWRFSEEVRAGRMTPQEFFEAESCMSRSSGVCMVMGTASTMASVVEALGLGLPQNAAIPAVDSRRFALAHQAGPAHRRAHQARRPAFAHPHARGVRERDSRQRRRRRLDERRHSPARDGRTRRRPALTRRLGHARPRRADARESDAVRPVLDGRFLLRRRRARGDAIAR